MEKILADTHGPEGTHPGANEKQLLLSRLLARLAHEIRNPLSSLGIHVQLLEEDLAQATPRLRAQAAGRFEIIRGELQRLETLMRQFLSLASPSSVDLQPVDLAAVVRYVGDLLRPEAAARGIALELNVPADLPALTADSAQLKQALVNLIINAIQAVERNGRIDAIVRADRSRGVVALQVSDNGPGVPGEKRSAIFEPFFTTKAEGSGLGLWIVQQIAMAHGGVATVGDPAGGGAVFTLELPLREAASHG
jgi:two-component system sensor histidine kinase HydH